MRFLIAIQLICAVSPVWAEPSDRAVRARTHWAPQADEARRVARLSLPSRKASLGQLDPHRLPAFTPGAYAPKSGAIRTGQHRPLEPGVLARGRWDTLADGSRIWRLAIHSPGALSMRLHFTGFAAGTGRVWVHDGSGEEMQIGGPYAGAGPFEDGDFWSDTVNSDTVIVEYLPTDASRASAPFQIAEISHVFHEPKDTSAREAAARCNLDVVCFAEWAETAKAVARISFESGGSTFVCSGTLLNTRNNSGDLLFLTANHCIDTDAGARTVQAIWNFQTASCNGATPSSRNLPTSLGARLLVTGGSSQGDFTLLRLNSVPSGVTFSGWDPQEVPSGTALTVIHHPSGDFKRIAFGNREAGSPQGSAYYSVFYSSGLTEGGSSGSGLFSSQLVLVGTLSNGPKADTPEEYCRIIPFADNYGRFSFFFPFLRDVLEGRGVGTTPTTPPPTTGNTLTSGTARPFSLPAVASPTLVNGTGGFRIEVPAGATRLDVRLTSTTPGVDVDLYVRFGQDVAITGGNVTTDFKSEGAAADESISITPTSTPALRAGTYFVGFGVFSTNVAINATVTATVTTGTTPPPTGGTNALSSGTPRSFTIPSGTSGRVFTGASGFTIDVPQGATRLDVRLSSSTPNVDLDLFVRFGQAVAVVSGAVVSDYKSEGLTADESISITPTSSPALRAGTYFISVATFTENVAITATVTATVTGGGTTPPPTGTATALTSGTARSFAVPAVATPTLINGAGGFTIQVPQGATRLDVRLASTTSNADLDLYVRFGSDIGLADGNIVTDHKSEGDTSEELISITPSSTPALRAGTYFIGFGVFSTGISINATVTATVTTSSAPPPTGVTALTSGRAQTFNTPSVTGGTLFNGARSFTIAVPQGATRLDIVLATTTANADLDLYARFGTDTAVSNGAVVADHKSENATGNERISIDLTSNPALRAGTYFITLAMFTPNLAATGTLTATVTTTATAPPTTGNVTLTSGVRQTFSFPASSTPLLNNGPRSFAIEVPANATRLDLQLVTSTPGADVDMYARFGSDTTLSSGSVVSDYRSEGPDGNERITITADSTPPLKPGRYFISLAVFTTNTDITGSMLATVTTAANTQSAPTSQVTLVPGTPAKFSLPPVDNNTLFNGNYSYKVQVPEGAVSMRIQVTSDNPAVDVDLYARFQADIDLADGAAVADYFARGATGNEAITITSASSPPLRPGLYFISLGLFTKNVPSTGSILVTIERGSVAPPASSAQELVSGVAARYSFPAVDSPTLFSGAASYRITVGAQHTRLAISARNNPATVDVDLFARFGQEPTVTEGRLIADARSATDGGSEDIVISGANLRPGVYFISLALFTTGEPAQGTLTATLSSGSTDAEREKQTCYSGSPHSGRPRVEAASDLVNLEKEVSRGVSTRQAGVPAPRCVGNLAEAELSRESGGQVLAPKAASIVLTPLAAKTALLKSVEAREEDTTARKEGFLKKYQPLERAAQ